MNATDPRSSSPPVMLCTSVLRFGFAAGPELTCPDHAWAAGLHLVQGDEGVGKTALLCTLAGELKQRSGEVQYPFAASGKPLAADLFWQHPRTVLSEAESQSTCRDWIARRAKVYPLWLEVDFERHIEGFALNEHMHKPLLALSTGSLRKLWMAAAWASGAALTLIDEPLAALDKPSMRYVQETLEEFTHEDQIERFGEARRCVIVTHWDEMEGVDWDDVLTLTSP
ncbi:ATP-binding cassette domain-containing protein [Diaphorobacter sp. HDW4A]|uniref:ATP-binding cassette domain-containing protein n=1 Tax=Diaphorobacter sp. HDW4A TaxID=2714924 RepID=UPI001407B53A|nr:ATP-binding cassette domain-containing protein [Diaphorobacter sp. HDW4A]QIL78844.1 ATP-binding cassette domain-containing protein [Diaphorobacter sp. HDW4A]